MWDPQIVAAPAGPRETMRHADWAHEEVDGRMVERSSEPRLTLRGGWAVIERCRHPLSVLLLVYTAPAGRSRRAVFRDTLMEEVAAQRFNWTAVFFTGRRPAEPNVDVWLDLEVDTTGDLVVFPFEDTFAVMSIKFVAAMRWAAENCPGVQHVVKMDDDVLIQPFQLQEYLEKAVPLQPRSLHCHVWYRMHVIRDPRSVFFETYELFPDDAFFTYCSGRTIIMTFDVMRDLLRAASFIPRHTSDDSYVTGDLALVHGIGHVDIHERYEWDTEKTDCIFNGSCMFTHEYFEYGLSIGRRSQWGLVLWSQRLEAGETLDLSPRYGSTDYAELFNQTRAALLKEVSTNEHATTDASSSSTTLFGLKESSL
ncbi:acetylgalactosaminyl-O-glycosyl-glycoprotein beta-1,3-N-acetylglucosaminyltransferase-like [Amblyomma americanum]